MILFYLTFLCLSYIYCSLNTFNQHSCVSNLDNYVNVEHKKTSSFMKCADACEENCYGVVFSNENGENLCVKLMDRHYVLKGDVSTTCGIPTNTFAVWKKVGLAVSCFSMHAHCRILYNQPITNQKNSSIIMHTERLMQSELRDSF